MGCRQQLLCCSLVCHSGLKFLVLLLAVFTCTFHLHLHLFDFRLESIDLSSQSFDCHLQVFNLGNQIRLLTFFLLCLQLICVELINAEIFVLDFISLLFQESCNHVIDCFLHALESIKLDLQGQSCEARAVDPVCNAGQHFRCTRSSLRLQRCLGL